MVFKIFVNIFIEKKGINRVIEFGSCDFLGEVLINMKYGGLLIDKIKKFYCI